MKRRSSLHAFTLIEMITVIAIIAILAGLILSVNGLVQRKSAMSRTNAEIQTLAAACESYKTDQGGYPQDPNITDKLDPRGSSDPTAIAYKSSSQFLYGALTGDNGGTTGTAFDGKFTGDETPRNYAPDFFRRSRFDPNYPTSGGKVQWVVDPFGYSYGYSTAGLSNEQAYRTSLLTNPTASRPAVKGYNATFDLWSTGGATGSGANDLAKWVKNW